MRPKLTSITANSGHIAQVPERGVTCIVGGNNVGKSQLLRDIVALLANQPATAKVLSSLTLQKDNVTSIEEVREWLITNAAPVVQQDGRISYFAIPGGPGVEPEGMLQQFNQSPNALANVHGFFCWLAEAGSRVGLANGIPTNQPIAQNPHPLGKVQREGIALEGPLSGVAEQAFGSGLTLDRVNGGLYLRFGTVDIPVPAVNAIGPEYTHAVAALPLVESQGDGVRSFTGLALHVAAGSQSMLLIDEPEAFLHPFQARTLGRWLAAESIETDRQVILSTHSRDIVVGLLEAECPVTLLRITREGDSNSFHQLDPQQVEHIWNNPVLRYSNILDGLFYRKVAICEGDADCRFYAAVLDGLRESGEIGPVDAEVLFVASNGKSGMQRFADTIADLGVRTFCIVDFDVLRERDMASGITEALRGTWSHEINEAYVRLAEALNGPGGGLWNMAKERGVGAAPNGDPMAAAMEIVERLAIERLLVVPVGELESFQPDIGHLRGNRWVMEMLSRRGHLTCEPARQLVRTLVGA